MNVTREPVGHADVWGVQRGRCRCGRCARFTASASATADKDVCAHCGCPAHRHHRARPCSQGDSTNSPPAESPGERSLPPSLRAPPENREQPRSPDVASSGPTPANQRSESPNNSAVRRSPPFAAKLRCEPEHSAANNCVPVAQIAVPRKTPHGVFEGESSSSESPPSTPPRPPLDAMGSGIVLEEAPFRNLPTAECLASHAFTALRKARRAAARVSERRRRDRASADLRRPAVEAPPLPPRPRPHVFPTPKEALEAENHPPAASSKTCGRPQPQDPERVLRSSNRSRSTGRPATAPAQRASVSCSPPYAAVLKQCRIDAARSFSSKDFQTSVRLYTRALKVLSTARSTEGSTALDRLDFALADIHALRAAAYFELCGEGKLCGGKASAVRDSFDRLRCAVRDCDHAMARNAKCGPALIVLGRCQLAFGVFENSKQRLRRGLRELQHPGKRPRSNMEEVIRDALIRGGQLALQRVVELERGLQATERFLRSRKALPALRVLGGMVSQTPFCAHLVSLRAVALLAADRLSEASAFSAEASARLRIIVGSLGPNEEDHAERKGEGSMVLQHHFQRSRAASAELHRVELASLRLLGRVDDAAALLKGPTFSESFSSDWHNEAQLVRRLAQVRAEGNAAFRCGKYKFAATAYTSGLAADPTNGRFAAMMLSNRAAAWTALKRYDQAIADCDEALRRWPAYHKVLLRRARAFVAKGGVVALHKAVGDLERVLQHCQGDLNPCAMDAPRLPVRSEIQRELDLTRTKYISAKAQNESRSWQRRRPAGGVPRSTSESGTKPHPTTFSSGKRAPRKGGPCFQRPSTAPRSRREPPPVPQSSRGRTRVSSAGRGPKPPPRKSADSKGTENRRHRRSVANHYKTLGVDPSAGHAEIKQAFRRIALVCHPDKCRTLSKDERGMNESRFKIACEAYSVLGCPDERAKYNRLIAQYA